MVRGIGPWTVHMLMIFRLGTSSTLWNEKAIGTFVETKPWLEGNAVSAGATNNAPLAVSSRLSTSMARSCVGRSK